MRINNVFAMRTDFSTSQRSNVSFAQIILPVAINAQTAVNAQFATPNYTVMQPQIKMESAFANPNTPRIQRNNAYYAQPQDA